MYPLSFNGALGLLILLVIISLGSCTTREAPSTFTIGVISPMSGPQASTGADFLAGLEWWRDKVNAHGGIKTRDGFELLAKLVVADTQGNDTLAAKQVVDFYRGIPEPVDALVNTFTAHNIAVNEAMQAANVHRVLMHCSGGTPAQYGLLELGIPRWPYQFGVMVPSHSYAKSIFKYASKNSDKLPNKHVAFIKNTMNPFTSYTCDQSVPLARENGLLVSESQMWEFDGQANEANAKLMREWVRSLRSSGTVMLMACTWLMDGLMLQQAIVDEQLELAVNIILIAPTHPKWLETFPRDKNGESDGDYVLSPTQWHHTQNFNDKASVGGTAEFAKSFHEAKGVWPNYLLASCVAAGVFLEKAMSRVRWNSSASSHISVGSSSKVETKRECNCDAVSRDAMLQGMVRDLMVETVYGDVRFDRHNQNAGHDPAVVQILPGVGQTSVLPESNSESLLYFPIPTWESRHGCPRDRPINDGYKCVEDQPEAGDISIWVLICGAAIVGTFIVVFIIYQMVIFVRTKHRLQREYEANVALKIEKGIQAVTKINFPMVLMRAKDFLTLTTEERLNLHEGLRDTGKLIFLDMGDTVCNFKSRSNMILFFSYQWLSWDTSGPDQTQWQCMQDSIQHVSKKLNTPMRKLFIWLDIFAIPQLHPSLKALAVDTLYVYASFASIMVIIAPDSKHHNTGDVANQDTYKSRVWCRAEQVAFFASSAELNLHMYLKTSSSFDEVKHDWMSTVIRIFEGDMTCCRLKHPHGQDCDRKSLIPTLMGLYYKVYLERNCTDAPSIRNWDMIGKNKAEIFPVTFEYATEKGIETKTLFGDLLQRIEVKADGDLNNAMQSNTLDVDGAAKHVLALVDQRMAANMARQESYMSTHCSGEDMDAAAVEIPGDLWQRSGQHYELDACGV